MINARLFYADINTDRPRRTSFVRITRDADLLTRELLGAMAMLLWHEAPNATVENFSDILTVQLQWSYGATKEPWQIEERVALGKSCCGPLNVYTDCRSIFEGQRSKDNPCAGTARGRSGQREEIEGKD